MSLYPENRRKFDPWKLRETSFKNVFSRDDIFHLSFCRQPHKIVPAKGLNFNELYFLPFLSWNIIIRINCRAWAIALSIARIGVNIAKAMICIYHAAVYHCRLCLCEKFDLSSQGIKRVKYGPLLQSLITSTLNRKNESDSLAPGQKLKCSLLGFSRIFAPASCLGPLDVRILDNSILGID